MAQFLSLILQRPLWEVSIFLIVLAGIVWFLVSFIFSKLQTLKIKKISKDGIELDSNEKKEPYKPPHSICAHGRDIVLVLKKQAELVNKVRDLSSNILPEQMKYAESKATEIRIVLQKAFFKLLADIKDSEEFNYLESEDYHVYRLCLRSIYEDLKDYVRICFRENHLSDKTESDFKEYVNLKIDDVFQKTTELLNELYKGKIVTRSMVHKSNQDILPILRVLLSEIFYKAREISISTQEQITKEEDEFDAFFLNIIG